MKTWTYALIGVLAALVVVAGVGGYFLGSNAGRASANAARSRFLAERMGGQGGNGGSGRLATGMFPGGGGTMGTVKSIEGNTIIVTTRDGEVKVQVRDNTAVRKMADGTLQDVQPGLRITVAGQADTAGVVTADSIQLMPANPSQ